MAKPKDSGKGDKNVGKEKSTIRTQGVGKSGLVLR